MTAAMPPGRWSPCSFISRPRSRTSRKASLNSSAPAATRAVYSPRLWPATNRGGCQLLPTDSTFSRIAARQAMETVRMAGWALIVSSSSSAGPSKHSCDSLKPRISSACWKTRRAAPDASYSALPMPTYCDPWPGKTYANFWASGPVSSASATLTVAPGLGRHQIRPGGIRGHAQAPLANVIVAPSDSTGAALGATGASACQYTQSQPGLEAITAEVLDERMQRREQQASQSG